MHGGLVPRKDAKYAKPPPTKNSFAAWRTWRLCVRSGCRVLTPAGKGATEKKPVLPSSRAPVLRAERRRPNAERRSAKARSAKGVVGRMARAVVGSDAGRQANARRVGSTQRRKVRQAAAHKEFLCGVAYLAPLREIRLPRPHSSGGRARPETETLGTRPQVSRLPSRSAFRASRSRLPAPVSRSPARRGAPHFVRVLKYGAASRPPALPLSGPNGEGPTPKCEVRRAWVARMARAVVGSDAGRQANARRVGSTQRRKEVRQAAAHKEFLCGVAYLAPLREIRLPSPHSRGGRARPKRNQDQLGNTPSGFTAPIPGAALPSLPFPVSRLPFPSLQGPARGASLRSGSEIRSGIPSSRAPVLPFSGPNGEGPTPKGEVRSAKCEGGCPDGKGRCRIGRWQAGECTAGWFHATAQRRTPSRRPQRIPLRRGVLGAFA